MNKPGRDKKAAKSPAKKSAGKTAKKTVKTAAKKIVKSIAKKAAGTTHASSKKTAKNTLKTAAKKAATAVKSFVKKIAKKVAKKSAGSTHPTPARGQVASTAKKTVSKQASAKISPPKKTAAKKTAVKKTATVKAAPSLRTTKIDAVKSRRPKSFAAGKLSRDFGFPSETPELPESYGEDRLVLMTKDPEYLFAYWEITPERQAAGEKAKRAGEEYREALRLNWTARDLFDANYALMPVSLAARKWYLRVPYSGLPYQIEVGWLGSQGHFISLLMSNPSDAPESWTATRRRLKQAGAGVKGSLLARTLAAGRPQGSSELPAGLPRVDTVDVPDDWNFPGPGALASSFGKKAGKRGTKPGSRG